MRGRPPVSPEGSVNINAVVGLDTYTALCGYANDRELTISAAVRQILLEMFAALEDQAAA
jgi:hypothetical protein